MENGYHTAKVEWIKDEPILEEELGNLKIIDFYYRNEILNCCLKLLETGKVHVQFAFWEGIHDAKCYCSSEVKMSNSHTNDMIYKILLTTDDIKDLHQRVYNQAKSWFTNLPLIPRVSSDKIIRFRALL